MAADDVKYRGNCLCGQIALEVEGAPLRACYCHCNNCRTWHAAPVNAVAVWPSAAVRIARGEEMLAHFAHAASDRHWCTNCGSGLFNRLRDDLIAVYAAVVVDSGFVHEAACHIHCDEAVMDLHDDVPKYTGWRDSALMPEPRRTGMRGR